MTAHKDQKSNEIIGWGLAGAVLSWQLYFRNQKFMVYDSLSNHTTRVAAGMVNPIVFKRLTKSWNADLLLPYAEKFYSRIEKLLDVNLVSNKSIFRVFASVEEENNWSSKQGDERFQRYLETPTAAEMPSSEFVHSPFGMGKVNTIGSVDTNLFLDRSKVFFQENNIQFVDEVFSPGHPVRRMDSYDHLRCGRYRFCRTCVDAGSFLQCVLFRLGYLSIHLPQIVA